MEKVLTVSIAAYNIGNSINDTLKFLIADEDTLSKMEVLIIDDGSKDDTALKAKEYEDKYPDTFRVISKENGGYGSTINVAVKEAKGVYFKQLDGGDEYITENLKDFIDYLSNHEADIIVTPHIKYYLEDKKEELINDYPDYDKNSDHDIFSITLDKRLWMHGIAFKTKVWNEYGREIPTKCFYTDMEYVLYPFVKAKTISFYDKPIYKYFLQCAGQSVSEEGIKKHYKDGIRMMWDLCDAYKEIHEDSEISDTTKGLFKLSVNHSVSFVYTNFVKLGKEYKKELIETDNELKDKYPLIYQNTQEVKRIRLLRNMHFNFIGLYKNMFK